MRYAADTHIVCGSRSSSPPHRESDWLIDNNPHPSGVSSITDPLQHTTSFGYDASNNLIALSDGSGATTTLGYQNSSYPYYPSCQMSASGSVLAYSYNAPGNLSATQDNLSSQNTLSYTYNGNGTIATVTDANGHTTTYGYDSAGNLTSITPPSGSALGATHLGYDTLSRVTSVTDGKGQKTTIYYDPLGHTTRINYADGSSIVYTYTFDDEVKTLADNTGTTTFDYNVIGSLLKKVLPSGTDISMTYDKVSNLASYADGASGTITYGYNAVNLLTSLTEPNGAKTTLGYDNANQRTSVSTPNGVTTAISYDGAGHETKIASSSGGTALDSFSYSYKNPSSGQLTGLRYSMTDMSGSTTSYGYDALDRLTSASSPSAAYSYSYDGAGNRTQQVAAGTTTNYTCDPANVLLTSSMGGTTTSYTTDANGNLTGSSAGLALAYNAKLQTTAITPPGKAAVPFTYSGPDQTERTQAADNSYTNGPLGVTSQSEGTSTTYYVRDNQGNLIDEVLPSGARYYYLVDGLGSVVGLTDASGNLAASYSYDPYGNLTSVSGSHASGNPWRYAGGYFDTGSGYYHFGARYYDPQLGRWTQQDPIAGSTGSPTNTCRYAYAHDDPVNVTDLSGSLSIPACALAISSLLLDVTAFGVGALTIAQPEVGVPLGVVFTLLGGAVGVAGITVALNYNPGIANAAVSVAGLEAVMNYREAGSTDAA